MKKTILATLATLALIGCGGGTDSGTGSVEYTPYPDAPAISQSQKQAYLDAVNEGRRSGKQCGDTWYPPVPDLVWNDDLYKAAVEHGVDEGESGHYAHDGSGTSSDWTAQVLNLGRGSRFWERILNNGYQGTGTAENIHSTQDKNLSVIAAELWQSPHHCANFMNNRLKDMGAAIVEGSDGWDYTTFDMGVKQTR